MLRKRAALSRLVSTPTVGARKLLFASRLSSSRNRGAEQPSRPAQGHSQGWRSQSWMRRRHTAPQQAYAWLGSACVAQCNCYPACLLSMGLT